MLLRYIYNSGKHYERREISKWSPELNADVTTSDKEIIIPYETLPPIWRGYYRTIWKRVKLIRVYNFMKESEHYELQDCWSIFRKERYNICKYICCFLFVFVQVAKLLNGSRQGQNRNDFCINLKLYRFCSY